MNNRRSKFRHDHSIEEAVLNFSSFYYETVTHSLDRRFSRTGNQWAFNQVMKSKTDKFHAPVNSINQKKKVIIVSDFSLNLLGKDDELKTLREKIAQVVQILVWKGFTVNFWDGEQLLKNEKTSECNWPQIAPLRESDLMKLQEQFTGSTLFHLDYFTTRAVLRQLDLWPGKLADLKVCPANTICLEDICDLTTGDDSIPAPIFTWLMNIPEFALYYSFKKLENSGEISNYPQFCSLKNEASNFHNMNVASPAIIKFMNRFREKISGMHLINMEFIEPLLTFKLFFDLINSNHLSSISWTTPDFTELFATKAKTKVKSLQQLAVKNISADRLVKLFESTPHLTSLSLTGIKNTMEIGGLPPTIKKLALSDISSVDAAHIMNLTSSNLEELVVTHISDPEQFTADLIKNENAFKNLKHFSAADEDESDNRKPLNIRLDALLKIHSLSSKITKLNLRNIMITDYGINVEQVRKLRLPHITAVKMEKCAYSLDIGILLLQSMPNISSLEIISPDERSSDWDINSFSSETSFTQLRKIVVKHSYSNNSLAAILTSRTPHLTHIETTHLIKPASLYSNLTQLSLTKKSTSFVDYYTLLQAAPRLTELNLSFISTEHAAFRELDLLPHIKTLVISNHAEYIKLLKPVLSILPNLEQITTKKPEYHDQDVTIQLEHLPEKLHLPKLKRAAFNDILINGPALAKILSSTQEKIQFNVKSENNLADLTLDLIPNRLQVEADRLYNVPLETYIQLISLPSKTISLNSWNKLTDYNLSRGLDLTSIKNLSWSNTNQEAIVKLLAACKNLENIDITYDASLQSGSQSLHFPQLNTAILHNASLEALQWLHNCAPNIRNINLYGNEEIDTDASALTTNFSFPNLQVLYIKNVTLLPNTIEDILTHSPQLAGFVISSSQCSTPFESIGKRRAIYLNIQFIKIENQLLSKKFILNLRHSFPNLSELHLTDCTGLSDCDSPDVHTLPHWHNLSEIIIDNCDINDQGIKQLLLNTSHLATFACKNSSQLQKINFSPEEIKSLPLSLYMFKITQSGKKIKARVAITSSTSTWLNSNSQLIRLELKFCQIEAPMSYLNAFSGPGKLEQLSLDDSQCDFRIFQAILENNKTSLKSLRLSKTNFIFDDSLSSHFPVVLLKKLTHLSIEESNLPFAYFLYFLKSTHSNFSQFNELSGLKYDQPSTAILPNIKNKATDLTFKKCTFSLQNFYSLLKNSPRLITFKFKNGSIIEENTIPNHEMEELEENTNPVHLRELDLSYTQCSLRTLITILISSPNLDTLNLEGITVTSFDDSLIPPNLCLPKLTTLKLSNERLRHILLEKLQGFAPTLPAYSFKDKVYSRQAQQQAALQRQFSQSSQYIPRHEIVDQSKDAAADPNPAKGDKVFSKQLFFPCYKKQTINDTRKYRLAVFNDIAFDGKRVIPIATEINDDSLDETDIEYTNDAAQLVDVFSDLKDENPGYYRLFDDEIHITNEWQRIPSYMIDENMLKFHTDYPHAYEIKYCEANSQYYIRGEKEMDCRSNAKFIVKLNIRQERITLPQEVIDLYNRCCAFTQPAEGETPPTHCSAEEILDWRYEYQVGSCGNRSLVFFNEMKQRGFLEKYPCRIIYNDPHAYIEIKDQHGFARLDLGGYPAPFEEVPANNPAQAKRREKPVRRPTVAPDISPVQREQQNQPQATPQNATAPALQELPQPAKKLPPKPAPIKQRPIKIANKNEAIRTNTSSTLTNEPNPAIDTVTDDMLHPAFKTWHEKGEARQEVTTILDDFSLPGKNTLLKVERDDNFEKIAAAFGQTKKAPYFIIDSADGLQWSSAGLINQQGKLRITSKFSALRHFINQYPNGVIFINWNRFSASDIVALHSILDEKRLLEGEEFPTSNPIVGCYNVNQPNAYRGTDFYSRFHRVIDWNDSISDDLYAGRCQPASPTDSALTINLYQSNDWETLLFGHIQIEHQQFTLQSTGLLPENDDKITVKHLHLKNAPWHLREFQLFWQTALQQGQFTLYGKTYYLASDFKLTYSGSHEINLSPIKENSPLPAPTFVLDSQTWTDLLDHYTLGKNNEFASKLGRFKEHANSTIQLQVAENLTITQWSQILDEAAKHHVKILLTLLPGASLPTELSTAPHTNMMKTPRETAGCDIIHANDNTPQVALSLLAKHPDAIYIQLDQAHEFSDLFYSIDATINDQNTIQAKLMESDVWKAAQSGQTIIVEGELPTSIKSMLTELFITGQQALRIQGELIPFKGKFIFVTPHIIPCALSQQTAPAMESQRQQPKPFPISSPYTPEQGNLSLKACEAYEARRFEKIMLGLNQSPLVFYTGTTGIGKTTYFLNRSFEKDYLAKTGRPVKIYQGEDQIEAYMAHKDQDADALLFIDEANLSAQRLSLLKSLQCEQPHLLINGHYYPKTSLHKGVVLVGNPNNYGGARQQQEFFADHTLQVECEKPNHAYLYQRVLKKYTDETTARIFLDIYEKLNQHADKNQQIVTARHLAMMAKVFRVWLTQFKEANLSLDQLAIAAALAVMSDSITPAIRSSLHVSLKEKYRFDADEVTTAQAAITKVMIDKLPASDGYEFLPSRYPAIQLLETFFTLHHLFPGEVDFGILFEGESGIGKSELAVNYAKARRIDLLQMTASKNFDEDRLKLTDAKRNDVRVLFDEINAGGERLEQTINTLGTGIIATQNPTSMAGRHLLSPAIKARFTTCKIPQYNKEEFTQVLMKKCKLTHDDAASLAQDFVTAAKFAEDRHLSPKPNLRSFLHGVQSGKIKPRPSNSIRKILSDTEFWRAQASGPRCDIPVGIKAMLAVNSLDEMQAIAKQRLANCGFTFFSSLCRLSATVDFYQLILAPDESKLAAFIERQKQAVDRIKVAVSNDEECIAYPPVHIMK